LQKFKIPHNWELHSVIEIYAKGIREGRLKVNSNWNKDRIKFTVQDPCKLVRQSLGDWIADELRFVVKAVVGEENFVDMVPNRSNNYCCGGGGGFLQNPYVSERLEFGKIKFDQIIRTGAKYVITPCHNCHSQIMELSHHYGGEFKVTHLWTLICLSLGILAENERLYLGDDLKECNLPKGKGGGD
jgi:Fe-S oxidoreductase